MNAEQILSLVEKFRKPIDELEVIARKMIAKPIEFIEPTGMDSIEKVVLKRLRGNIKSVQDAYTEAEDRPSETVAEIVTNPQVPTEVKQQRRAKRGPS